MKISVMWMTRKRSHELIYSLASFINNADDSGNIEYIFTLDPDDEETRIALEKVVLMAFAQDAELICTVMDKRYGYAELEQYQNKAGELFTGECLFILNDDLLCISQGWDTKMREVLEPKKDVPAWIGLAPINEWWKGTPTFVGINRKWYEIVGRVSGTRATDGYLKLVGQLIGMPPVTPDVQFLHLQRGKKVMEYDKKKDKMIYGLPDDGAGGYTTKKNIEPKYVFESGIGKQRLDEDVNKLKKWMEKNNGK
ncbi:MAG: hypothetical protein ACW98D_13720 [Promethearchaeota archaeon]|jgi:hypothetical protein